MSAPSAADKPDDGLPGWVFPWWLYAMFVAGGILLVASVVAGAYVTTGKLLTYLVAAICFPIGLLMIWFGRAFYIDLSYDD